MSEARNVCPVLLLRSCWRQVPAPFIGSAPLARFQPQFALGRAPDGVVEKSSNGSQQGVRIERSGTGSRNDVFRSEWGPKRDS